VTWYPRDEIIVWLVRLVDGAFPERGWSIGPTTALHWFDLFALAADSGRPVALTTRERYALPDDRTAGIVAACLRDRGADLLSGNLDRLTLEERRIRELARADAIARFGAEGARSLGW
jgi:hypothetical protein